MADKINLEDVLNKEREKVRLLRERFESVFATGPETPEEYYDMKKCYDTVGQDKIDEMRVLMGTISNPSIDLDTKLKTIEHITGLLSLYKSIGKEVQYLYDAFEIVLKHYDISFKDLPVEDKAFRDDYDCINWFVSRNQRIKEKIEHPEIKDAGTTGFYIKGCFSCNGHNRDCQNYFNRIEYKKIMGEE